MDPDQAWKEALAALHRGDSRECYEHLADLRTWIRDGGFVPNAGQETPEHFSTLLNTLIQQVYNDAF
jgi:hypothetical protein